ncbi:MAG TPA: 30S ribosomal protein S3 [Clostridiales bacterium]|nr:30S ribosomal protein S3 [Clostridiales bacterium]
MGQKVNPNGFRIGVNKDWNSQWYADKKSFAKYILEDHKIREVINKKYAQCGISKVVIDRTDRKLTVNIYASKPGMLIGVKGAEIEVIKKAIAKIASDKEITINIREVKRPDIDATLVAQSIAAQLEKRVAFKRACKMAIQKTMKAGAKGVKVMVSGRLNGAEIARSEHFHEGSLPLQTLRANIDYGFAIAETTFGVIGVKVWVYNGDIIAKKSAKEEVNSDVNA